MKTQQLQFVVENPKRKSSFVSNSQHNSITFNINFQGGFFPRRFKIHDTAFVVTGERNLIYWYHSAGSIMRSL